MKQNTASAFTLIELLIVIAVIAILAAISVPNFLCAQVRAKVSRAKADIRTLTVALEAYNVDKNAYPPDWDDVTPGNQRDARMGDGVRGDYGVHYSSEDLLYLSFRSLEPLTTPVAHLASIPTDPFSTAGSAFSFVSFTLRESTPLPERAWLLASMGPDLVVGQWRTFPADSAVSTDHRTNWPTLRVGPILYDATNGCISQGDILRTNNVAWYPRLHGLSH